MQKIDFNKEWRFRLGSFAGARWGFTADDTWRTLDLPHDWSIEQKRAPNNVSGVAGGFLQSSLFLS